MFDGAFASQVDIAVSPGDVETADLVVLTSDQPRSDERSTWVG